MKCIRPNCAGGTIDAEGFCDNCGMPPMGSDEAQAVVAVVEAVAVAIAPPAPAEIECPNCKAKNKASAAFCEDCGFDFTNKTLAPVEEEEEDQTVVPTAGSTVEFVIIMDPTVHPPEENEVYPVGVPEKRFPFDLQSAVIGRKGGKNDISIEDPAISGRHLKFTKTGSRIEVVDLGSSNGSVLNGNPMVDGVSWDIKNGDEIVLGKWTRIRLNIN